MRLFFLVLMIILLFSSIGFQAIGNNKLFDPRYHVSWVPGIHFHYNSDESYIKARRYSAMRIPFVLEVNRFLGLYIGGAATETANKNRACGIIVSPLNSVVRAKIADKYPGWHTWQLSSFYRQIGLSIYLPLEFIKYIPGLKKLEWRIPIYIGYLPTVRAYVSGTQYEIHGHTKDIETHKLHRGYDYTGMRYITLNAKGHYYGIGLDIIIPVDCVPLFPVFSISLMQYNVGNYAWSNHEFPGNSFWELGFSMGAYYQSGKN